MEVLGDDGQKPGEGGLAVGPDLPPVEGEPSGQGVGGAGEQVEQGGLAAAVRPEEAVKPAGIEVHADIDQDRGRGVAEAAAVEDE